ncbi:flagellar basal body-associated FliL family protein [Nocardioides aromaticivorans]|uniref:flagellar basal body-associated FliL family protein n=1 Tax=Nocardioides aromaticivorans TaxID=200618 RepID=UPI000ABDBDB3|nr:flagellar basal body-associated FliL family protein [Nocardioides aromaticivorans]
MSTTIAPSPTAPTDAPAPKGKGKMLVVGVLVLAVAAGAGWFFFLKPSGPSKPQPGEVMPLEAIQVNLSGGHYLRLGMALQLTTSAHEADGSQAMDAAIGIFSGLPVAEVNNPGAREKLRKELEEELEHRYHGDVMDVYFTEFVTQ